MNKFIKKIYYKPIEIMIDIAKIDKVIINMIVRYYDLSNSIMTDKELIFTSNF